MSIRRSKFFFIDIRVQSYKQALILLFILLINVSLTNPTHIFVSLTCCYCCWLVQIHFQLFLFRSLWVVEGRWVFFERSGSYHINRHESSYKLPFMFFFLHLFTIYWDGSPWKIKKKSVEENYLKSLLLSLSHNLHSHAPDRMEIF